MGWAGVRCLPRVPARSCPHQGAARLRSKQPPPSAPPLPLSPAGGPLCARVPPGPPGRWRRRPLRRPRRVRLHSVRMGPVELWEGPPSSASRSAAALVHGPRLKSLLPPLLLHPLPSPTPQPRRLRARPLRRPPPRRPVRAASFARALDFDQPESQLRGRGCAATSAPPRQPRLLSPSHPPCPPPLLPAPAAGTTTAGGTAAGPGSAGARPTGATAPLTGATAPPTGASAARTGASGAPRAGARRSARAVLAASGTHRPPTTEPAACGRAA